MLGESRNGNNVLGNCRPHSPHLPADIIDRTGRALLDAHYAARCDLPSGFVAAHGQGAFLNDRRLRVAARTKLTDAVVACGLPHLGRGHHGNFLIELRNVMAEVSGIRRLGSAALDLAYVAAGRMDGYWEDRLSPWDIAAGILMVREAGGYVSDPDGGQGMLESGSLVAGNEAIHRALLATLKKPIAAR